jgi:signal transduction histidine kinase
MMATGLSLRAMVLRRVMPAALAVCVALWAAAAMLAHADFLRAQEKTLQQRLDSKAQLTVARIEALHESIHAMAANSITVGALIGQDIERVVRPYLRSISFTGATTLAAGIVDYRGQLIAADDPDAWRPTRDWPRDFDEAMAGRETHRVEDGDVVVTMPLRLGQTIEGALVVRVEGDSLFASFRTDSREARVVPTDAVVDERFALEWRDGALHGVVVRPVAGASGLGVRVESVLPGGGFWDNPVQPLLACVFLLILGCVGAGIHVAASRVSAPVRDLIAEIEAKGIRIAEPGAAAPQEIRALAARLISAAGEVEEALTLERELAAQQRQFVSMVSHEFRTPLAIIDGAAGALSRRRARMSDAAIEDKLATIRGGVSRMIRLMESTLVAARMDAGRFALARVDFAPGELVERLVAERRAIEPGAAITVDVAGLPPVVHGDERLLASAIDNLLSNAVKYGGATPEVRVRGWTENGMACLSVTDNGVGIPPDEVAKIGERFFRASTSTGVVGTGIGLNMARMVLAQHDGDLLVDSAVGVGSTFTLRLPLAGVGEEEAARPSAPPRLWRLAYVSRATAPMTDATLEALIVDAAARNRRDGLSGCLMHRGGVFAQVLEGSHEAVERRFAAIARDPRHAAVEVRLSEGVAERAYPDWRCLLVTPHGDRDLYDLLMADVRRRTGAGPDDATRAA